MSKADRIALEQIKTSMQELTKTDVARILRVSERTVWRWVKLKAIPQPRRVGRRFMRFSAEEIRKWQASGCQPVA